MPPAPGTNSLSSMPMPRRRHSRASHAPEVTAIWGMSPSLPLRGRRNSRSGTLFSSHCFVMSILSLRRHLPTWTTTGTSLSTGTFFSSNSPLVFVRALTIGLIAVAPQRSQVTPCVMGGSSASPFGPPGM